MEVEFTDAVGARHLLQGKSIEFSAEWHQRSTPIPSGLGVICELRGDVAVDGSVAISLDLPSLDENATFLVRPEQIR